MPQTGPDLVSAGYPISRPLLALLGGNGNSTQANVPIKSNLDFGLGGLQDTNAASGANLQTMAVPVSPGDVINKVSLINGATTGSPSSAYAVLFTGTGSAPGTTGVSPVLISQSASTFAGSTVANTPYAISFATPVTLTAAHCPYGFIYVSVAFVPATGSPTWISMTCASVAQNPIYPGTSPYTLYGTGASTAGNATLGTTNRAANPPVVLLS